nr:PaaI family thioesterase [Sphingobium subterraneum]
MIADETTGWTLWDHGGSGEWPEQWPAVAWRPITQERIVCTLLPPAHAGNRLGYLHGGFLASYAETCLGLFSEAQPDGCGTVTVSLHLDYPAPARVGLALTGEAELLRETGRMQFVRLDLRQEGALVLTASGVLRKVPRASADKG